MPPPPLPTSLPNPPPARSGRLVIIGAGNMGAAIARGVVRAGLVTSADLVLADPDTEKLSALAKLVARDGDEALLRGRGGGPGGAPPSAQGNEVGTARPPAVFARAGDAIRRGAPDTAVLVAVKPQSFAALAEDLRSVLGEGSLSGRLVISIMAGVSGAAVQRGLGAGARVVRAMPNLAATVGLSMTGLCAGPGAGPEDVREAERVLRAVGRVEPVPEELMDAFTALSGSGPAYVFYLAQAMIEAGVALGLDAASADRVCRGVIEGAAGLLSEATRSPAQLRAGVTSKGGTTEAATAELEAASVREAVARAVAAAARRGGELRVAAEGGARGT